MGWTYSYNWETLTDVLAAVTKGYENETSKLECIAYCTRAFNTKVWSVFQYTDTTGKTNRFIMLFLIHKPTKDYPYWGYKEIDEAMGPYHFDCPLPYLDLAPEGAERSEHAATWRKHVRDHWAAKAERRKLLKSLKPSDVVTLPGCTIPTVTIVSTKPRILGRDQNGVVYRIKPSQIGQIVPQGNQSIH